jgi:hypothetical protein
VKKEMGKSMAKNTLVNWKKKKRTWYTQTITILPDYPSRYIKEPHKNYI